MRMICDARTHCRDYSSLSLLSLWSSNPAQSARPKPLPGERPASWWRISLIS